MRQFVNNVKIICRKITKVIDLFYGMGEQKIKNKIAEVWGE